MNAKLYAWLAMLGAAVLAVLKFLSFYKGTIEDTHELEETNEYIETRKRIDAAAPADPDDVAAARDRLQRRATKQR